MTNECEIEIYLELIVIEIRIYQIIYLINVVWSTDCYSCFEKINEMQFDIRKSPYVLWHWKCSIQTFLDIWCHFCGTFPISFSLSYHISQTLLTIISFFKRNFLMLTQNSFSVRKSPSLRHSKKEQNTCPLFNLEKLLHSTR